MLPLRDASNETFPLTEALTLLQRTISLGAVPSNFISVTKPTLEMYKLK